MFTVERLDTSEDICIDAQNIPLDQLLAREWLLTNKRGSFSSSTLACSNTRKYHGLLIGSLSPPVKRIMSLNNLLESIKTPKKNYQLCSYEFDGLFSPEFITPQKFYQDGQVKFEYSFEGVKLVKSVCLAPQKDIVFVIYDFLHLEAPVTLEMRPFVGLRDFHSLLKSSRHFIFSGDSRELVVRRILWPDSRLILSSEQSDFVSDEQWWYNILYRVDKERGLECCEDLWSPGIFRVSLDSPRKIVFRAELQSVYPAQNQPQEN